MTAILKFTNNAIGALKIILEVHMARDTHRVLPNGEGSWKVQRDGNLQPSHITTTQREAERIARSISINQGTELQIHGRDGRIRQSDSHGNDPRSSKG